MNIQKIFLSILGGLFLLYISWFLWLYSTSTVDGVLNLYSNTYGVIPLISGIYGLFVAQRWGGFKSAVGRAISFLSLGLITWGIGMVIWLYYNIILGVGVPYPSFADAAFILSWPLWAFGVINLSKATGATFQLRKSGGKIFLLIIPIAIAAISYYLLVNVARGGAVLTDYDTELSPLLNNLKLFFDLAYPIGDIVILALSVLIYGLSFQYLGGRFKLPIILILLGFVVNYFADFTFSYTTTLETYYNGSLADVLFVTTMTLLGVGIALFNPSNEKSAKNN